ncbi:MAG: pre-peptidase C-terminal domain-containing protein [Acidobacteria bacterium]|nr:pre-peptidase C-terminal domain-containing protein [Acidobacteriota bacterium]
MKSAFQRPRYAFTLFVILSFIGSLAFAFGYKAVASRTNQAVRQIAAQSPKPQTARTKSVQTFLPEDDPEVQEFFRLKRLPAGETLLSEERYAVARQKLQQMNQRSALEARPGRPSWQRITNSNTSSIAQNADSISRNLSNAKFYHGAVLPDGKSFVGGTTNQGVLRAIAQDGGYVWEQIQPGISGAVAVDRNYPNRIFINSQNFSLRRSTDGGQNFTELTRDIKDTGVLTPAFVVDELTSQRIWLGGTAIWRTDNGGTTWQQASASLAKEGKVSTLAYATSNHNFVLAGTSEGSIYRTFSGLTSMSEDKWQSAKPRSGYVSSVVVDAQNPSVIYATYATFGGAHVWRSDDAGASWANLDGEGANALPDMPVHSLVIDPRNAERLFIGTDLGVFTTTDGGKNWSVASPELGNVIVESLAIHATDETVKLFAFTYGNGVWQTNVSTEAECTYSISTSSNPTAFGGSFSIYVSTSSECGWTATSNTNWITITSAKAGKGSATINCTIPPSFEIGARTGTVTVGGQTVTVTQNGLAAGCEVKPIKVGETVSGTVKTGTCVPINSSSGTSYNAAYLTFTANQGDSLALIFQNEFPLEVRLIAPNGAITYASTTSNSLRIPSSGFLTIANTGTYLVEVVNYFSSSRGNFTMSLVAPSGPPACGELALSANSQTFEASGGNGTVEVSAGLSCNWMTKSNATWLTVVPANGTGNGTVSFAASSNTTAATRSGTLEIAGQTFTVTQAGTSGSCSATPINIGQTINAALTTGDCNSRYNFESSSPRPADLYSFTANEGQQVMVAATAPSLRLQVTVVDQNGMMITPYGIRAPLGTGYFTLPATGTYFLQVKTDPTNADQRTTNYSVSLLSAASGCGYVLSPTLKRYEGTGGNDTASVTSGNGCGWIATTHQDWITINTPAGNSSGNVEYTLAPNTTGRSRTGGIFVSGQSIAIEQAATGGTCNPLPLTLGQTVSGSLDLSDCRSSFVNSFATDRYELKATAGQQLRVEVNQSNSSGINIYLIDATGRVITNSANRLPNGDGYFAIPTTGNYLLEIANTAAFINTPYTMTVNLVGANCNYKVTPSTTYFDSTGGAGSLDLVAGTECPWNASTGASWITLAANNGSGNTKVAFTVAPNTAANLRTASISIAGQTIIINQAGTSGSCTEKPLVAGQTVSGKLTSGDCRIRAVPSSFTTFADRYSFSGTEGQQILLSLRTTSSFSGITMYLTDATGKVLASSSSRLPTSGGYFRLPASGDYFVEVAASSLLDYFLTFSVLPVGCNLAIAPNLATVEATGGNGTFKVIAGQTCPWSVADIPDWVTISTGSGGTGSSTVNFTVAANTASSRRRATLTVGGQVFNIEQPGSSGSCGTTTLTSGQAVKGTLGAADCRPDVPETARPITDRYTFMGMAGNQVALSAVADLINNFTPTVSITLRDPAGVTYATNNQRVPNIGFMTLPSDGQYTVEVTSSTASNTTNVNYSLLLETVAPQCSFKVSPTNNLFEAAGGTSSIAVQATENTADPTAVLEASFCLWNVTNLPSWITVSDGASGAGNGTVNFKVAENTSTVSREATILVAGNPVRVEQAGKGGSCGVTPLTVGQTVNGTNSSLDCRSRFRRTTSSSSSSVYYARQFSFNLTAGQQLALTATNTSGFSFTPYLYIYDSQGAIVAQGEARLPAGTGFFTLPATGTYFVELTSRDSTFGSSYSWTLNLSAPTACAISLLPPQTTRFDESGGTGTIGLVAGTGCQWTAQSNVDWLTINASGTGNGQIDFTVTSNPLSSSRRGTITVDNQTVTIEQTGVGGTSAITPLTFGQTIEGNLIAADSTVVIFSSTYYVDRYYLDATAGQQLALAFSTGNSSSFSDQLLRVLAPSGSEVASSTSTPSSLWTRLPISGRYTVEVTSRFTTDYQLDAELAAATCNFVVRPADQTFEPGATKGTIDVIGPQDCAWLITRIPSWLTFTSKRYKGTAKVEFALLPNSSTSLQIADLTVAGQPARIQQLGVGGSCTVKPIALGQVMTGTIFSQDCRKGSSGSYHRYRFNGNAGDQIAVVGTGASGLSLLNANGTTFANISGTRLPEGTGYISLPTTGDYFVDIEGSGSYSYRLMSSEAGCGYVLATTRQGFATSGGNGSVNVLSLGGCPWTASSDVSWVTIKAENRTGSGNGVVNFTVAPNNSINVRRTSLIIAGQIFVVEQAGVGGVCTALPITPGQNIPGSITPSDCQNRKLYIFNGTAGQQVLLSHSTTSGSYLSLSLLAPDGSSIASNSGYTQIFVPFSGTYVTLPQTGTYTIVVGSSSTGSRYDYQLGLYLAACAVSISPPPSPFAATGGSGTVNLSSANGCGWSALSTASWIQIKSASGTGNGKIEFTVASNTSSERRNGTILIGGKTLNIEQAGTGGNCQVTPLKPGQFLSGTLGSNDCRSRVLSNNNYAEWYSISGLTGDQLQVQFTGTFTPTLSLLTSDGRVLSTGRGETLPLASGFYTLPASGDYLLEISNDSFSTGSYRVSFVTARPGCGFNLSTTGQKFEVNGGIGRFNVSANGTCQWYAYSDVSWITVGGTGVGIGSSSVNYTVAANTTGLSRLGRIYVSGQIYTVEQAGIGGTCNIVPINFGQTITGEVTEGDCRTFIRPSNPSSFVQRADTYSFTGMTGDRIVITTTAQGTTFTPQVSLFGPNRQLLVQGNRIPRGGGSYILPANGTYLIEISTTGGYSVKLELQ